jgi:uncharacterized membrane protein YoaK (UPF0700 family)
MSISAGFVDAASFLALQGLFAAHVTGNFVTFAAATVHGTSGTIAKLLALPTFCIVVMAARLLRHGLDRLGTSAFRPLITLEAALLSAAAALAITRGPFADADAPQAIATGMLLVAAMAIQNAVHRVHLSTAPPSTVMTGTSTQIMLDVADAIVGVHSDQRAVIQGRLRSMSAAVAAFAVGCALAALGYVLFGMWCLVLPPVTVLLALLQEQAA